MSEQNVYIAGICGTFMAGMARIAGDLGFRVGGCDKAFYPPMSEQLKQMNVSVDTGFTLPEEGWDCYVIGNALSRGNELVEAVLDYKLPFCSGPQWLHRRVLRQRRTLCVAGTHGKTTTSSMLAWILEFAGMSPGFLIGGVPTNFGVSSRLGRSNEFVIEGDEYDTAFFDKRSKFLHYHPQVLLLNNLEFDHADIFPDLEAVKTQFHYLMRTVPAGGLAVVRAGDNALRDVLARGCWCEVQTFGLDSETAEWQGRVLENGFELLHRGKPQGVCEWDVAGEHNVLNAVGATAVANRVGITTEVALAALKIFQGVSRRLEVSGCYDDIVVYDDFAHHPTEIKASIAALRARSGGGRLVAVVEPRSNTMKIGCHNADLVKALATADRVFFYQPADLRWSLDTLACGALPQATSYKDITVMSEAVVVQAQAKDQILVMSNGDFGGICQRIGELLGNRATAKGS